MSTKMIQITFPDGASKEFPQGTTIQEIAHSISPGLAKRAVAGKANGQLIDLSRALVDDAAIEILTLDQEEGLEVYRHSTAHLMAQAIQRMYGDECVSLGVGPVMGD